MKRIATTLLLVLIALVATRPASAQSCETSVAAAAFRAGIDTHIGPAAPYSKASREQRVAALEGVLPVEGPARCLMLAGLNLLPDHRLVSADGQLTSIVDQVWADPAWEDESRTLLSYTDADFPAEIIEQEWDGTEWVNVFRVQFEFVDDVQASSLFQEWDGTQWVNVSRSEFTYDGDNLLTSLSQSWVNEAWVNETLTTYTYDDSGNEATFLTQSWDNEAWVDFSRTTTSYDEQDRETESLTELYDETEEVWMNASRTETVWSGDTSTSTNQFWSGEEWFTISRSVTTFDDQGRDIQLVIETLDFLSGGFSPTTRITFTYDGAGNETQVLIEAWDGSDWVNDELETNTFDNDDDITEALIQDWNGAGWDNFARTLFNYGTSTALEDAPRGFAVSAVDLFPNPVRDRLTVDVTLDAPGHLRVEVYDLLGRRVATLSDATAPAGVQQLRWEADGKPAGLYLVRLESGGKTMTHTVALIH